MLAQLSQIMAEKREETPLQVRGRVNGRIAIAVAKSYLGMIRGARLPSPLWEQEPDWDTEFGIGLVGYTSCLGNNAYKAADASQPQREPPPPCAQRAVMRVEPR